jgi:hypothetical protein
MVIDGTTGQSSIKQVEEFSKYIKIDGIIISKLDGSAIGGTIVSIIDRLKIPVFGIGMGENKNSLEEFDAEKCNEMCDNCQNPKTKIEGKHYVKLLLEAIDGANERFEPKEIAKIMMGESNALIKQKRLDLKSFLNI